MAIDTPVVPPENCLTEGDTYLSIYDIPNKQRATFYCYADAHKMLRQVVVPESDIRCDYLGLVDGVPYWFYYEWIVNWDSRPVLPSMQAHDGEWYTLAKCDQKLADKSISEMDYYRFQHLWNVLQQYMLHPFRHNTASIESTSKVWTWYELESDMLQLHEEIENGANLQTLLESYIQLSKFLTDGIMQHAYDYYRPNQM